MVEPALIVARLLQYAGAAVLFGSSLLFVCALPDSGREWEKALFRWLPVSAAAVLGVSAVLGIAAQASLLAGSWADGLTAEAMGAVVSYLDLGKAAVVRALAAAAALAALLLWPPGRASWRVAALFGAIAAASLAWMGHAAATEGALGTIHLVSDVLHVLAAALWIGALVGLVPLLLAARGSPEQRQVLHHALRRFSGIGPWLVAVLVLTGLVNGWILVGPEHVSALWATPYGRLLAMKLALFLAMLALAAANRLRFTPRLGRSSPEEAIGSLQRSIGLETLAGFAVLFLVAWLGTLEPAAAV